VETSSKALSVLVVAEAANPEWESVPLVGWSLAKALSSVVSVHLVTHCRNKKAIEPFEDCFASVTYIDSELVAKPLWKLANFLRGGSGKGWTMITAVSAISYYYFERLVWKTFRERIKSRSFDLVHRVTPLSPTTPSTLAKRCNLSGTPFLLGPLNGGVKWPAEFSATRKQEKEWLSYIRNAYRLLPGYENTLQYSSAILCGSLHTQLELGKTHQEKSFYIPENAIDPARFPQRAPKLTSNGRPLKICFLGRLVPYKGADMLLEACLPLIEDGLVTIDIVGDGPQKDMLVSLSKQTTRSSAITFHGWVAHKEVHNILGRADVLGFPSIREFGGGVVLEAMALGVVPLVIDYAGPGELVNDQCGFKLKMASREEIIRNINTTIHSMIAAPDELVDKSLACVARIASLYTWNVKAAQITSIYEWLLNRTLKKPSFDFLKEPKQTIF
jgi:glycosyltransferase involved in cell wall biosynthesis